jgi:CcmD family protein
MTQETSATLAPSASPEERSQEFKSVQGGADTTSAGTLLVVAYLVMWALLLGFILMSWRRQGALDGRLKQLERALDKADGAKDSVLAYRDELRG